MLEDEDEDEESGSTHMSVAGTPRVITPLPAPTISIRSDVSVGVEIVRLPTPTHQKRACGRLRRSEILYDALASIFGKCPRLTSLQQTMILCVPVVLALLGSAWALRLNPVSTAMVLGTTNLQEIHVKSTEGLSDGIASVGTTMAEYLMCCA